MFQTVFNFTLPKGFIDKNGKVHRQGKMRLATAADEINASKHPIAKGNPEYLIMAILASVIVELEGYQSVTAEMIESFYATDFQFLQHMYQTLNRNDESIMHVICPHCGIEFTEIITWGKID